ncbi:MAG: GtrA family protein [Rhizobiaceae bacterium]|nr:GtrA family protein [Rhizobiaceae bacterium]
MTAALSARQGRLARFVAVGLGANLLLLVLSYLFRQAGLPAFVAGAGGYAIAFVVAYAMQRGWTFASDRSHGELLPRYLGAQLVCAVLSGAVGHVVGDMMGLPALWMSVAVTLTAGVSSYVLSSRWVFAAESRSLNADAR